MSKSKAPCTELSLRECRRRDWTVEKREYWQASFATQDVVTAAKRWRENYPNSELDRALSGAIAKLERAGPGVRKDAFGFIDIEALDPERPGVLGIQATTKGAISTRRKKILGLGPAKTEKEKKAAALVRVNAIAWLKNGNQIEIWGWDQPGGYKKPWLLTVRAVTLADFEANMPAPPSQ